MTYSVCPEVEGLDLHRNHLLINVSEDTTMKEHITTGKQNKTIALFLSSLKIPTGTAQFSSSYCSYKQLEGRVEFVPVDLLSSLGGMKRRLMEIL